MNAFRATLFTGIVVLLWPARFETAAAATETVLYSFCSKSGCADGDDPEAGLLNVKGKLYGTTYSGGSAGNCPDLGSQCGTVFSIDPTSGVLSVVYSFGRHCCDDGGYPLAGVVRVNGVLYGTTLNGGGSTGKNVCDSCGCGTVFAVDPKTGRGLPFYSFCSLQNCSDGSSPRAGLIDVNGTLYGTTTEGGTTNGGTVFSVDPSTGAETVLYSFCAQANCTDGTGPASGLLDVNGTLYGTTTAGGCSGADCGVVYSIDLATGAETVIYAFCSHPNCADGGRPEAGLIDVKGRLYGTTIGGGAYDNGTVFSIDPATGAEVVVHSFAGGDDGAGPSAGMLRVKGTLYGTNGGGGSYGFGTVFSIDLHSGTESVLHSFGGSGDGEYPNAGLIEVNGVLYGTTSAGGAHKFGTVFSIMP